MSLAPKKPQPEGQENQEQPPSSEEKLVAAQAEVEKWRRLAASPNLGPKAAAWVQDMVQSAQAEVRLRQKGLAYQNDPERQTDDGALAQLLGLTSSPQDQPNPSPTGNQTPT